MSITKKILLGTLAIGIGGAGYYVGTWARSQPTKATVELEPISHKENASSNNKQLNKAKDANSTSKQTKNKTDDHKNHQDVVGKRNKSSRHTNKSLFLTGRNTKQEYSPQLIKRANQIYKHRTNLSFRQCLALARKEND